MIPKGLLRLVKICLAGSLLLTCSFIRTSVAEAPYLISSKLNNEELITRQDYCDRIELLCEQYDFAYFSLMIWLAEQESSLGQNKTCGDNGLSCGLYQYKEKTWELFQGKFKRPDLERDNDQHQIEMTIIALRNGQWYHWQPLLNKYSSNPICEEEKEN